MGHWSDIKNDEWHWPNFTPKEIACRGTGELVVVSDAMDRLQTLRELLDRPLHITSAYRSRLHNARIGGVSLSRHRGLGGELAFDILIKGLNKINKSRGRVVPIDDVKAAVPVGQHIADRPRAVA
jgi:hypothetical protein